MAFDTATGRPLGPQIRTGDPVGNRFRARPRRKAANAWSGGRFWDVVTGQPIARRTAIPARPDWVGLDFRGGVVTYETEEMSSGSRELGLSIRLFGPDGSPRGVVQGQGARPGSDEGATSFWPGGEVLAIAHKTGDVVLYDLEHGTRQGGFHAAESVITAMAIGPDGASLVSGTPDGRVRAPGTVSGWPRRLDLPTFGSVISLRFTPDGRRIGVLLADGSIRLWTLPSRPVPTDPPDHAGTKGRRSAEGRGLLAGRRSRDGPGLDREASQDRGRSKPARRRPRTVPLDRETPHGRQPGRPSMGHFLNGSAPTPRARSAWERRWAADRRPIAALELDRRDGLLARRQDPGGDRLPGEGLAGRYDAETGRPSAPLLNTGLVTMSLAFARMGGPWPSEQLRAPRSASRNPMSSSGTSPPAGSFARPRCPIGRPHCSTARTANLSCAVDHSISESSFGRYQILGVADLKPRGRPLEGTAYAPGAVAFLPGDRLLTCGLGGLWGLGRRRGPVQSTGDPAGTTPEALSVSPGTRWLAILDDRGDGQIYDAATYRPFGPPLRAARPLAGLTFAPDGRSIVGAVGTPPSYLAASDSATGPARNRHGLHRARDRHEARSLDRCDPSPDDSRLATTSRRRWTFEPTSLPFGRSPVARRVRRLGRGRGEFLRRPLAPRPPRHAPAGRLVDPRPTIALFADQGRFDQASDQFDLASKSATAGSIRDWEFSAAVAARDAGRLVEARWHLDRLLQGSPDEVQALIERSEVDEALGRSGRGDVHLDRATQLGLDPSSSERAVDRLARSGRWDEPPSSWPPSITGNPTCRRS